MENKLDNELFNQLGKKIKKLRKDNKISQQELACILNVTRYHVSNIETGRSGVALSGLYRLCKHFDISADYFLGISEDMNINYSKNNDIAGILRESSYIEIDGVEIGQRDKELVIKSIEHSVEQIKALKSMYKIK